VTQVTQTIGFCVTPVPAGQGPVSAVRDAGDAASPYLGKEGGWCLLLCAAQGLKKGPLRGTSLGRCCAPNSKRSTPPRVAPGALLAVVR
jgi:hypothetical protein